MRPFLEEAINPEPSYGTSFTESYDVDNQVTAGSASRPPSEYSRLRHPYPRTRLSLNFNNRKSDFTREEIMDLYHRVGGTHGGFRVHHHSDHSTNNYTGTPTVGDQELLLAVDTPQPHRYQLTRWYGTQGDTTATRRRILKPVAGTVLLGVRDALGVDHELASGFTVDTSNGTVDYAENQGGITNIVKGAETVVTVGAGHGYALGESVVVSGVSSMTEINGLRANITATAAETITLAINSNGFTDYVVPSEGDDGQVNQAPQSSLGEAAIAGCLFDLPMRFETDLTDLTYSNWDTLGTTVQLVELLSL